MSDARHYPRQVIASPRDIAGPGLSKAAPIRKSWLKDVQEILGETNLSMAELLGVPVRSYEYWKAKPETMPVNVYRAACALLAERQVDSRGRMLCAKAVG